MQVTGQSVFKSPKYLIISCQCHFLTVNCQSNHLSNPHYTMHDSHAGTSMFTLVYDVESETIAWT